MSVAVSWVNEASNPFVHVAGVSAWVPQYAVDGQPFPTPTGGLWAVDAAGGVFEETNQDLQNQIVGWVNGEWGAQQDAGGPSTPIQDPRSSGGVMQLLPAGDLEDAAYFMSKEAAFYWLQNLSGRAISGGNRAQQVVQGVGAQFTAIGQDFNEGNVGAGLEGLAGELVNTTPLGAGTGLGNQLLQGAGALEDPTAQEAASAFQATATAVDAVGQGAMTGGVAGGLKAGLGALGALQAAAQSATGGAPPPPQPAAGGAASSGGGLVTLALLAAAVYMALA